MNAEQALNSWNNTTSQWQGFMEESFMVISSAVAIIVIVLIVGAFIIRFYLKNAKLAVISTAAIISIMLATNITVEPTSRTVMAKGDAGAETLQRIITKANASRTVLTIALENNDTIVYMGNDKMVFKADLSAHYIKTNDAICGYKFID